MKAGELYQYAPDAGKWCRHGLRQIVEGVGGTLYAIDTYWCDWLNGDPLPVERIADRLEFLLDLNEARIVNRDEWERCAEKDRAYIPIGGGSEQYWVSASAKKDPQKERRQLERNLEDAEAGVRAAQYRADWARKQLADFLIAQGGAV